MKGGHGGKAAGGAEVADFSNVLVCLRRRSVQTLIVAGALAAFGIYSPLVYLVRILNGNKRFNAFQTGLGERTITLRVW